MWAAVDWWAENWGISLIIPYLVTNAYLAWSFADDQGEWELGPSLILVLAGMWIVLGVMVWSTVQVDRSSVGILIWLIVWVPVALAVLALAGTLGFHPGPGVASVAAILGAVVATLVLPRRYRLRRLRGKLPWGPQRRID